MGRIRGRWIKNLAEKFVETYPGKFNKDFENNKKILTEMALINDKPIRNKVAGYIVNIVENKKKE